MGNKNRVESPVKAKTSTKSKKKAVSDAKSKSKKPAKTFEQTSGSDVSDEEEVFEKKRKQLNSKKKVAEKPSSSNDENVENEETSLWPHEDLEELISQIEALLPKKDKISYKVRADNLDWDKVAFKSYSSQQCRLMWDTISKKLRGFRILAELLQDAKEWVPKPWKDFYRRKAKNNHPDMPKRPLSSYMIFYVHMLKKVKKSNPKMEMTALTQHISQLYKELPEDKKKKYTEQAAEARAKYDKEIQLFYENHPELKDLKKTKKNSASLSELNNKPPLPPKPLAPFKLFFEDRLQKEKKGSDFDKAAFQLHCREVWNNMSAEKKGVWINWSIEQEEKYNKDICTYKSENPDYEAPTNSAKSTLTKEEVAIRNKLLGKPDKPPNSAYSLFSTHLLTSDEMRSTAPKDRMLLIAQQWRSLSDEEKKSFEERVQHLKETYKLEYAAYLDSLSPEKRDIELELNTKKKPVKKQRVDDETAVNEANHVNKKQKTSPKVKVGVLFEGEPTPPPIQASLLYARSYRGPAGSLQTAWKSLTEKTRNKYKRQLQIMKQTYMLKYEEFLKGLDEKQLQEYSNAMQSRKEGSEEIVHSSDEEVEDDEEESDKESVKAPQNESEDSSGDSSDDSD